MNGVQKMLRFLLKKCNSKYATYEHLTTVYLDTQILRVIFECLNNVYANH